ncbi:hypothetical protein [Paracoccus yeei]|uniref:hypothetical protein n=1 Tax=Paracoccus yeei TaxID=147645 RepID=UPI0035B36AAD
MIRSQCEAPMSTRSFTPSQMLLKEVRAELVARGTSLAAFCRETGYTRQAVIFSLSGQRTGARATSLGIAFLRTVEATR